MQPLRTEPRYMRPQRLRRDPAPSRLAFRLERLWLTPAVRALTRIGAPIFGVTLVLGLWLGDAGRRADLMDWLDTMKLSIENRPEFLVSKLDVTGASPEVADAVRMMLPVGLPASRFAIDLTAYHDAITRLDAVKEVALVVRSGGTLEAKIVEREPVILWRTPSGIEMLDETGHRTALLTRRDARPDLALVAGDGADAAVPEALAILEAEKPILAKTRGLLRVGERRWDIVLEGGRRIELPEKDPVKAVQQVLALNASQDLLARDFTRIDLRDEARPTIRLSANALDHFEVATGQKKALSHPVASAAAVTQAAATGAGAKPAIPPAKAAAPATRSTDAAKPAPAAAAKATDTKTDAKADAAKAADASAARPSAKPQTRPEASARVADASSTTPTKAKATTEATPTARPVSKPKPVAKVDP